MLSVKAKRSDQMAIRSSFQKGRKLFLVAGEQSGDMHGAALMKAMLEQDPRCHFSGVGGPRMKEVAKCSDDQIIDWTPQAAVVGLSEVIKKFFFFRKQLKMLLRQIEEEAPNAVLLIDFSGFNLRLAEAIRRQKLPVKIFYFISPQFWASRPQRVKKMAQLLDHVMVIFPFEEKLLREAAVLVSFVGHPLVEQWEAMKQEAPQKRESSLLALFPGSRRREVTKIAPSLIKAAQHLREKIANLEVAMAVVSQEDASWVKALAQQEGVPLQVGIGNATELMQRATFGLVCSGTATLQAATLGMPYALVYKVAWLTYEVGRRLIRIPYLGIINVLAHRLVVPELIQSEAKPEKLAEVSLEYFSNPVKRQQLSQELLAITAPLAGKKSYQKAATTIINLIPL